MSKVKRSQVQAGLERDLLTPLPSPEPSRPGPRRPGCGGVPTATVPASVACQRPRSLRTFLFVLPACSKKCERLPPRLLPKPRCSPAAESQPVAPKANSPAAPGAGALGPTPALPAVPAVRAAAGAHDESRKSQAVTAHVRGGPRRPAEAPQTFPGSQVAGCGGGGPTSVRGRGSEGAPLSRAGAGAAAGAWARPGAVELGRGRAGARPVGPAGLSPRPRHRRRHRRSRPGAAVPNWRPVSPPPPPLTASFVCLRPPSGRVAARLTADGLGAPGPASPAAGAGADGSRPGRRRRRRGEERAVTDAISERPPPAEGRARPWETRPDSRLGTVRPPEDPSAPRPRAPRRRRPAPGAPLRRPARSVKTPGEPAPPPGSSSLQWPRPTGGSSVQSSVAKSGRSPRV